MKFSCLLRVLRLVLLGMLLLLGTAVLAVQIRGGILPPPARVWSQFPALVFGHLPVYKPAMPREAQVLVWLPYAIFVLAAVAGVGMGQAWRARRWSLVVRVLLTVVIVLLLVLAALIV